MKQYFTGFITAAVFTSSLFLFIGAKKRTIDSLTVRKISIVDNLGNQVGEIGSKRNDSYLWLKSQKSRKPGITLSTENNNGAIMISNSSGKGVINIGPNKNKGGRISLHKKNGSKVLEIESDNRGNGRLICYNHRQKETLFAGTSEINSGQIKAYNALGVETVFLGTDNNDAGLVGVNNNSGRLSAFIGINEIGNGLMETTKK
jgi:hypothetical protein